MPPHGATIWHRWRERPYTADAPRSLQRPAVPAILAHMTPAAPTECPRARDDVVFRQLDQEWVVFDPRSDRLHALNLTAALVWTHCTGELEVSEIAAEVGAAFDPPVPGGEILADVQSAIARFGSEGLLA